MSKIRINTDFSVHLATLGVVPPLFNKLGFEFFYAFANFLEGRRQYFLTSPRILKGINIPATALLLGRESL